MEYVQMFQEYMGNGLVVGWYLVSLAYLLMKEKRRHVRILFVYVPLIILLLFFNPLFAKLISLMEDIYWRLLWLLPISMTIAYTAVRLYGEVKGKMRVAAAVLCVIMVTLSGSYIYQSSGIVKAENEYHVPQTVVDICDAIIIPGREIRALFPDEMLYYVRQYTPLVCMPYGREVFGWVENDLNDLMREETIDLSQLAGMAKEYQCHYIILPKDKQLVGNLLDYEYILFDTIDGYQIYKDTTMNFSVVSLKKDRILLGCRFIVI